MEKIEIKKVLTLKCTIYVEVAVPDNVSNIDACDEFMHRSEPSFSDSRNIQVRDIEFYNCKKIQ